MARHSWSVKEDVATENDAEKNVGVDVTVEKETITFTTDELSLMARLGVS